jgi:hypothetical protein
MSAFEEVPWYIPAGTEENHEHPQSVWLVSLSTFKLSTSQIRNEANFFQHHGTESVLIHDINFHRQKLFLIDVIYVHIVIIITACYNNIVYLW